jgi:hypothetical protein
VKLDIMTQDCNRPIKQAEAGWPRVQGCQGKGSKSLSQKKIKIKGLGA